MTRIYAINTSDRKRMRMLWDPELATEAGAAGSGDKAGSVGRPTPASTEETREAGAEEVDLAQANTAKTSATVEVSLMRLLERYHHVFSANPKIVRGCNRGKL